jgi:MFS transporter, ACS family, glucarate transporter
MLSLLFIAKRFADGGVFFRPSSLKPDSGEIGITKGVTTLHAITSPRVRWYVVAMLFGLSFASYMERVNLSVAAELMMPALSLTKSDLAIIFNSFLLGYALFQIPAGWLGDRLGPRMVLGLSGLAWGVLTVLSGLLPGFISRTAAATVALLVALRFLLGATEASTYPVAARAVHQWMPAEWRGFGNSLMLMGSSVASAITAPFVAWSMVRFGWRASFYLTSVVAFAAALLWLSFTQATRVSEPSTPLAPPPVHTHRWLNTNVALLSLSYVSEGYLLFMFVSWLYIYLVEVRGFSLARGGLVAALPWLAAIAATPLGGFLSDRIALRLGRISSARVLIMTGYTSSGVLLLVAALVRARPLAVLALCISLGSLYLAESSFWTTAASISGSNAGVVSGFMNTIGILGGIASNSIVPLLVKQYGYAGWIAAFSSGTAMGFFSAVLWWILGKRLTSSEHSA